MFKSEYVVKIRDVVKSGYAHSPEDGEIVAKSIIENYKGDMNLVLDFLEIKTMNTAFGNKLIEPLYEKYGADILNKYFSIKNHNELIKLTFMKVIENYKEGRNDSK